MKSNKAKFPKASSGSGLNNRAPIYIDGENLSLSDIHAVVYDFAQVGLSDRAKSKINANRTQLEKLIKDDLPIYGVNTGFGKFKDVVIPCADRARLQHNLILSHAAGVGPNFDSSTTRAIMLLRANSMAKGYSAVRCELVEAILSLLNKRVHPLIPEQGSVGASGDLAPLAHMSLVLLGEGQAEFNRKTVSGKESLKLAGLNPVVLEEKEGLSLINGTQIMSGLLSLIVLQAQKLAKIADVIGAMTLEALLGSQKAFSDELQACRPHPGQVVSAKNLLTLLADSELMESHADCGMVQDAYSIRCMPQVHGASRQAIAHTIDVLNIEINSATDNPLLFRDEVVSGGNFHGQPLALVADYLAIALCELGNISERRTERLVNPALSNGLPACLVEQGGLNSGLMMAQYTAAALVSENKSLAHPASVDSIPTSANQEDHVSMGTIAARKARMILHNLQKILAIELVCATQALDLRTGKFSSSPDKEQRQNIGDTFGLKPGLGVKAAQKKVRESIDHLGDDRLLHRDFDQAEHLINSGELLNAVESAIGELA